MQFKVVYRGKKLLLTTHANMEAEAHGKTIFKVLDVLERGEHIAESKEKSMAALRERHGMWEVVYVEFPDYFLAIHFKFVR